MTKENPMSGEAICNVHNFKTILMSKWKKHLAKFEHTHIGTTYKNGKEEKFEYTGKVPTGFPTVAHYIKWMVKYSPWNFDGDEK